MKINSLRIFYFFLFILFLNSPALMASNDAEANKNADSTKTSAAALLKGLKQGGLLVRLKTSENSINTLIARGRTKEAEALKAKQYAKNLEVYRAFKEKYKFGNVYFFYSTHSKEVKTGQLAGIFLDSSLQPDSSITLSNSNYFIAEIGDIQSEATTSSIHGLHIMDADMKEINVRNLKSVWHIDLANLKVRTPADMVEAFNKRLFKAAEKTVSGTN